MRLLDQLVVSNVAAEEDAKDLQPDTSRMCGLKLSRAVTNIVAFGKASHATAWVGWKIEGRHTMRKEKVVILRRPQGLKSTDSAAK